MKGWITGLMLGIVLGSAVTGAAQGVLIPGLSAASILEMGDSENIRGLRIAYIFGVSETLFSIEQALDTAPTPARFLDLLQKQTNCLRVHARRAPIEFLRWADGVWQMNVDKGNGKLPAAGVLFIDACK